jgi:hypothetical protein
MVSLRLMLQFVILLNFITTYMANCISAETSCESWLRGEFWRLFDFIGMWQDCRTEVGNWQDCRTEVGPSQGLQRAAAQKDTDTHECLRRDSKPRSHSSVQVVKAQCFRQCPVSSSKMPAVLASGTCLQSWLSMHTRDRQTFDREHIGSPTEGFLVGLEKPIVRWFWQSASFPLCSQNLWSYRCLDCVWCGLGVNCILVDAK